MGFVREVANRIVFMDAGQILESNTPANFFANPPQARSKLFPSQTAMQANREQRRPQGLR
jgi:general L-amino acid transport system ATP-binding protein